MIGRPRFFAWLAVAFALGAIAGRFADYGSAPAPALMPAAEHEDNHGSAHFHAAPGPLAVATDDEHNHDFAHFHAAPRSGKWPTVRKHYIEEHPACEACGAADDLEVHHVLPFHLHPDRELDPANLITLCRRCHLLLGHAADFRAYNPHVRADAALVRQRIKNRRYERKRKRRRGQELVDESRFTSQPSPAGQRSRRVHLFLPAAERAA